MAYCSRCGAVLKEGAKYCAECGAQISNVPARTIQVAPQYGYPVQEQRKQKKRGLLRRVWFWLLLIIMAGVFISRNRAEIIPTVTEWLGERTAISMPVPSVKPTQKPSSTPTATATPEPETPAVAKTGIRPEVKEFLDDYEACVDEYVEFMQKYMNSDGSDVVSMMGSYYSILSRYTEFEEKIDAFDEEELTNAEEAYLVEVMGRVSQKLLTLAGG